MAVAEESKKNGRLTLRASEWQRQVLAAASIAEGTSITDFVLRHATRAAEDVLADRRVFLISAEAWDAFDAALEAPARDVRGLRELLAEPSPFAAPSVDLTAG